MLDLTEARRIAVIGGGITGWFAGIALRRVFKAEIEVTVIEAPELFPFGLGEEGSLNLVDTLSRNDIALDTFIDEADATYRLGVVFENWRGGGAVDQYYHLLGGPGIPEIEWRADGFFPFLSARIALGEDLHSCIPGFEVISRKASQHEFEELLETGQSGLYPSYHFDAGGLERFLKRIGSARGVTCRRTAVHGMRLNDRGHVHSIQLSGEELEVDFVVDASGFARIGLGTVFGARWRSFENALPIDRVIAFHPKPTGANPEFVTHSTAMKAGWMWQVPLNRKVSAGYVFSSRHTDDTAAVGEVERRLGRCVEPMHQLTFEQGCFETAWINNLVALGAASGFVEPLQAALTALTLEQLRNIERVLSSGGGIVPAQAVETHNTANAQCWTGVRDFLRLHYDCPRKDTPFWRDVAAAELPDSYVNLRECFQRRTPRLIDIQPYVGSGWQALFHQVDWMSVAAPLGVIPAAAARAELRRLPAESRDEVQVYLHLRNGVTPTIGPSSRSVH